MYRRALPLTSCPIYLGRGGVTKAGAQRGPTPARREKKSVRVAARVRGWSVTVCNTDPDAPRRRCVAILLNELGSNDPPTYLVRREPDPETMVLVQPVCGWPFAKNAKCFACPCRVVSSEPIPALTPALPVVETNGLPNLRWPCPALEHVPAEGREVALRASMSAHLAKCGGIDRSLGRSRA